MSSATTELVLRSFSVSSCEVGDVGEVGEGDNEKGRQERNEKRSCQNTAQQRARSARLPECHKKVTEKEITTLTWL